VHTQPDGVVSVHLLRAIRRSEGGGASDVLWEDFHHASTEVLRGAPVATAEEEAADNTAVINQCAYSTGKY
jgi:hypothetical protein